MTDTDKLVAWLRDFTGPGSNGTKEAADVIEALRADRADAYRMVQEANDDVRTLLAERDALRAQLDNMTTQYEARIDSYRSEEAGWGEVDAPTADRIKDHPDLYPRGHVRKRLVGPWDEVTD